MAADLEAAEAKLGVDLGALSADVAAAPRDSRSLSSGQSSSVAAMASFLANDSGDSEHLELYEDGREEGAAGINAKLDSSNDHPEEIESKGVDTEAGSEAGVGCGSGGGASSGGGRALKRARRSESSPPMAGGSSALPSSSLAPPKPRPRPLLLPNLTVDTSRHKTTSRSSSGPSLLARIGSRNNSSNSVVGLGMEHMQRTTSSGDLWNAEFAEMGDMAWMEDPSSGGESSSGGSSLESNQPGSGGSGVDSASGVMGGGGLASSLSNSNPGGSGEDVVMTEPSSRSSSQSQSHTQSNRTKGRGANSVGRTSLEARALEPTSAQITFEVLRSVHSASSRDMGEEPATPELIDAIRGATGGGATGREPHSATNLIRTSSSSSRTPEDPLEGQALRGGKQLSVSIGPTSSPSCDHEGGGDDEADGADNEPSSTDQDSSAEGGIVEEEDLDDDDDVIVDDSFALAIREAPLSVLCFSRALLFNADNVPALIALGRVAMRQQQWRLAAERLKRVVNNDCVVTKETPSATAGKGATPTSAGAPASTAAAGTAAAAAAPPAAPSSAPEVAVKKAAVAALAAAESLAAAQAEGPARVRAKATAAAKDQAAVAAAAVVTAAAAAAGAVADRSNSGHGASSSSGGSSSGNRSSRSPNGSNSGRPETMTRVVSRSGLVGTTVWRDLGFCLLRAEDLPKACRAYAHALALHREHSSLATAASPNQENGGNAGSDWSVTAGSSSSVVAKLGAVGGGELANELTALAGQWGKEGHSWPSDSELWFGLGLLLARLGAFGAAADCLRACALMLSSKLTEDGNSKPSSSSNRSSFARLATCRLKLATLLRSTPPAPASTSTTDASAAAASEAALSSFAADLDAAAAAAASDSLTSGLPTAVAAADRQPLNGSLLGVPGVSWTGPLLPTVTTARTGKEIESDDGDSSSSLEMASIRPLTLLLSQVAVERGHCLEAAKAWEHAQEQYELALRYSTGGGGRGGAPAGSQEADEAESMEREQQAAAPQLLQQLGWLLFSKRGDLRRGVALLEEATRHPQGKQDWRSWYLLGRLYMVQAAAASTTVAGAAATPSDSDMGDTAAADPAASSASESTSAASSTAASSSSSSGPDARALWSSAYRALECAVHLEPTSAASWASVGFLMTHLQQHHDALDALSRALRANPRDPDLWCTVGGLYDMKQQWRDAREAYQQAVTVARLTEAPPPTLAVERLAALASYS